MSIQKTLNEAQELSRRLNRKLKALAHLVEETENEETIFEESENEDESEEDEEDENDKGPYYVMSKKHRPGSLLPTGAFGAICKYIIKYKKISYQVANRWIPALNASYDVEYASGKELIGKMLRAGHIVEKK